MTTGRGHATATDVLAGIVAFKRIEVARGRQAQPDDVVRRLAAQACRDDPVRGFESALRARAAAGMPAVIAEIKQASPSKGLLRAGFDPPAIARSYAGHRAACLSVLTDEQFFHGSLAHLRTARAACPLPALRKDFIVDEWQLYQARAHGADCVLLIAAILDDAQLAAFAAIARELTMDVLVEVHGSDELERVLPLGFTLIGVNNRNLRSFDVSLETTLALLPRIPPAVLLVTESGIRARADVARMRAAGVHAFLVGEALMRAADPGQALRDLFG